MSNFGLVGRKLGHSFSQQYFNDLFKSEGLDHRFDKIEIEEIGEIVGLINEHKYRGLCVTIPYKEEILPFLDSISSDAEEIGAVNSIKIDYEDDKPILTGYNTDYIGFRNSIFDFLKPHHTKALVLGYGGAAKGICYALKNLGIEYKVVSRRALENGLSYDDLSNEIINEYTVIVNCTPLGTFPNVDECPNIPYQFITDRHLLFDLVYNPAETKFLRLGKENGATIKNGYDMLALQADASWVIWNR